MPEKQKARDRKEIPTVLAAIAMTLIVTMWNGFANHDRKRVGAASPSTPLSGSVTRDTSDACTTPVQTLHTGARCMTVTRTRSS